jgi:hypothetical protein
MKMESKCGLELDLACDSERPVWERRQENQEIAMLKDRLLAAERDRDVWREAAQAARDEKLLQGCLGNGRTGLIRAMRDAFAGRPAQEG